MECRTAMVNGSKIHYWVHNPDCRETIVAVHGFRGNHKALTDFADQCKGQRVILIDLPGHGLSDTLPCEHTLENFASFLDSFVHSLLGMESFTLWGHSYGGSICIEYAAKYPKQLRSLVLVSPAISVDGFWATLGATYYKTANFLPKRWQRLWLANPIVDQISAELLIKNVSKQRKLEMKAAGRHNLRELNTDVVIESSLSYIGTNLLSVANRIKIKTLIIAGALDQVVSLGRIEVLASVIPNAKLVVIPDHGHLSPLETPAQVARLTLEYVEQV